MIKAKVLICTEKQNFSIEDVSLPDLKPGDVLIKTLYSGVSIGTEFLLVHNKISWGGFPICLGYQSVGIVEETGKEVDNYKKGDKVYSRCCSVPMKFKDQTVSPTSGTHCSHIIIDAKDPSAAHVPAGTDDVSASLFVMPAVGLNGVNMADVQMGDTVAVMGAGLIGLGVIGTAKLRGATVIAIDIKEKQLEIAAKLGADHVINSAKEDISEKLKQVLPDKTDVVDVVFEASGNPKCVDLALPLCKWQGKFVFQGNYGSAPLSFNFIVPHGRSVTAFFPCNDGGAPCRNAVMSFMESGALKWQETITHRIPAEQAPEFYDAINQGKQKDVVGAVIKW